MISCVCVLSCFSNVWFVATTWTVAHQAPLSMYSSGKNTGVGCHALLQRIFPNQGSNLSLLYCRQILYHWASGETPNDLILRMISCSNISFLFFSSFFFFPFPFRSICISLFFNYLFLGWLGQMDSQKWAQNLASLQYSSWSRFALPGWVRWVGGWVDTFCFLLYCLLSVWTCAGRVLLVRTWLSLSKCLTGIVY